MSTKQTTGSTAADGQQCQQGAWFRVCGWNPDENKIVPEAEVSAYLDAHTIRSLKSGVMNAIHPNSPAGVRRVALYSDAERLRDAAPALLAALQAILKNGYIAGPGHSKHSPHSDYQVHPEVFEASRAAVALALPPVSDEDEPEATYGRMEVGEDLCVVCGQPLGEDHDTLRLPDRADVLDVHPGCAKVVGELAGQHRDNPARFVKAIGRLRKGVAK